MRQNISEEDKNISPDNVLEAKNLFEKTLMTEKPSSGIRELEKIGLIKTFIPELQKCVGFDQRNPHHDDDVFEHILKVLDNSPRELTLRWSALLHDVAKPITFFLDDSGKGRFFGHDRKGGELAREILGRFGYDKKVIEDVAVLVENHMCRYNIMKEKGVRKLIGKVGERNIEKLFKLQRADIKGRKGPHDYTNMRKLETMAEYIIKNDERNH